LDEASQKNLKPKIPKPNTNKWIFSFFSVREKDLAQTFL